MLASTVSASACWPDLNLASPQDQACVDAAAEIQRGLGEPAGQFGVEHLTGALGRAAEQGRVPGHAGVELPAAQPQQILPAARPGRLDGAGQDRRDPPQPGARQALAQRFPVHRMGQPGDHSALVLVHLHEALGLGVLEASGIGDLFDQRDAEWLAGREQFDHGDRSGRQPGEPGRNQFHQTAWCGKGHA